MPTTLTTPLTNSWAWLVGIPDEEYGFLCCDHALAQALELTHCRPG